MEEHRDDDLLIDTVGQFYATVYDDTISWLEKVEHRFEHRFHELSHNNTDDPLACARSIAHFTLCMVAAELQNNEEQNLSPSIRYHLYHDGEEIKDIDAAISPVSAWLGDIIPGEGLLGLYARKPLPKRSIFDISGAD